MRKKSTKYEINEKDIDAVLRFLKTTDPENATPEKAIEILEKWQAGVHMLGHVNPEALEELHKELEKAKKTRN